MKYLLFIVLLVAVVITAGCVSENKSNLTPTSTLTPTIIVTSTVPTIVPTTIPTPIPVSITYLTGNSTCLHNCAYNVCFDKDVNVSIKNNTLTASGILFYERIPPPIQSYQPLPYCENEPKEVSASAKLKIYNNKSVKVAEVSKPISIDKNGKTLVELNTEISENNPIGWTYIISIEKNPDVVTTVTPTREIMDCNIVSSQGHRYSTEYTISGYAKQTGRSGTCIITVELFAGGQSVNSKDTPL